MPNIFPVYVTHLIWSMALKPLCKLTAGTTKEFICGQEMTVVCHTGQYQPKSLVVCNFSKLVTNTV